MIQRLVAEGNETVTNCNQLKMLANDGKMRLTDVADQMQDPELNFQQAFGKCKATPK